MFSISTQQYHDFENILIVKLFNYFFLILIFIYFFKNVEEFFLIDKTFFNK